MVGTRRGGRAPSAAIVRNVREDETRREKAGRTGGHVRRGWKGDIPVLYRQSRNANAIAFRSLVTEGGH